MDVTPDAGGQYDERSVFEQTFQPDRLYVMDRGYAKFDLFNKIVASGSSYVCRVRDNSIYDVIESRELSEEAVAAGLLRIATNLIDVPAEVIALIYSQRWIIEIFFRFSKQLMGCNHLIFHSQNGIEIQCYCAVSNIAITLAGPHRQHIAVASIKI